MEAGGRTPLTALYSRIADAHRVARREQKRSRRLQSAIAIMQGDDAVTRCAWCGRARLGEEWISQRELADYVPLRVLEGATHGICWRCFDELQSSGASH